MQAIRAALFAVATTVVLSSTATAQDYPSKPIKLIVPTAAAGIGDIVARQLQQKFSEANVTIVVENRPGAAGVIGTNEVARAPADGYTFLVGNHAVLAMLPHLQKVPYDPFKSFMPVFLAVAVPNILVVHPTVPAKNVKELIAHVKANPGKLTYASANTSGVVAGATLKHWAKLDMLHVPYKSAPNALQDLLPGRVSMMFNDFTTSLPHIKSKAIRPLASTRLKRSSLFPELPTMDEAGVEGFDMDSWAGIFAPANTPQPIVTQLNTELRKIIDSPETKQKLRSAGFEAFSSSPKELDDFVKAQLAKWGRMVKDAGIQPE